MTLTAMSISVGHSPQLINLTQHIIRLFQPDGMYTEILPNGKIARVASAPEIIGYVDEIPILYNAFEGPVHNLPNPVENVIYITSSITAEYVKRPDVVAPDTSPRSIVRDETGRLYGVKALRTYAPPYITCNDHNVCMV